MMMLVKLTFSVLCGQQILLDSVLQTQARGTRQGGDVPAQVLVCYVVCYVVCWCVMCAGVLCVLVYDNMCWCVMLCAAVLMSAGV